MNESTLNEINVKLSNIKKTGYDFGVARLLLEVIPSLIQVVTEYNYTLCKIANVDHKPNYSIAYFQCIELANSAKSIEIDLEDIEMLLYVIRKDRYKENLTELIEDITPNLIFEVRNKYKVINEICGVKPKLNQYSIAYFKCIHLAQQSL